MRFFKYLVLIFASIISVDAIAAMQCTAGNGKGSSPADACSNFTSHAWKDNPDVYTKPSSDGKLCEVLRKKDNGKLFHTNIICSTSCPQKGWPVPVYLPKGTTRIPTRMCKDGCTIEGGGHSIETNNYTMTTMQFTGDSVNCNEAYGDEPKKCDTKDPYGDCFVPPNDDCVRLKDGSIQCPDNSKPPENNTCNGADYCKRPPQGCGTGYVPGSFNGEQLCVRSGPNKPKDPPDPDKPDDPNNCMNGGSYCPQPPDNTKCPSGYYETTYNGSKICVKDNPDPEKPNPNDPNGGKGPDGGDNGGDGGDNGGDGSTGGSINLKPVIDAINALKNALLSALSGISGKIDQLINGQKQTNEKLDKSNDHLDKIEDSTQAASETLGDIKDATQATSEAVGESNKKLDGIKDAVEGMYKCKNESYNPNDKNSSKYRECTEQDAKNAFGEQPSMPFKELDLGSINTGLFKVTGQCPAPYKLFLPVVNHTFDIDISKLCDVLAIIGYFIALAAMIHGIVILVENS